MEFVRGAGDAVLEDLTGAQRSYNGSHPIAHQMGQMVGHAVWTIGGMEVTEVSALVGTGGAAFSFTGGGALAGVPAVAAGAAGMAAGGAMMKTGIANFSKSASDLSQQLSRSEGVSGGVSKGTGKTVKLPSQGTVDAGVPGAPKVDAGKQGKHVLGHPNSMPGKKTQWPEGEDGVKLTQEAWVKGNVVKPDGSVKIYDFHKPIGANGETRVKVHVDKKGNIHGYPVK